MKKLLLLAGALTLVFSCHSPKGEQLTSTRVAKGDPEYGGLFRVNEVEDFRSLYPLNITEVTAHRITNQIYEGLVKFNQSNLAVIPSLAESWEVNGDATSFTFHLRKGVYFHDDPCFVQGKGREVTADDFAYCFTRLCVADPENLMFWLFKDHVVGANEYYQSTLKGTPLKEGVTGVKVIDDYTLEIDLEYPFAGFLSLLGQPGCWVYPEEAVTHYGADIRAHCVGTGPFKTKLIKENEAVILERNPRYWRTDRYGNALPFLDAIRFSFLKEKKTELMQFRKGELDMVFTLPLEMIGDVLSELRRAKKGGNLPFEIQIMPAMSVQYYGFQHKSEVFSNIDVRKAFNYAVDRKALLNFTLQGDGVPGNYGIVPPAFKQYGFDSIQGYSFDPEKAKAHLAVAGYPNGKGFPKLELELNSGGSNYVIVAQVVQKMLKEHLNIDIELREMSMAQYLDNSETGKSLFFRQAWLADYPDPENFLNLLYGKHVPERMSEKSYLNPIRYQSPKFDSIFELATREIDAEKRFRLYRMADQVAIDDAAIMPLYYEEFTRLLHQHVKNFPQNGMEYRDFSEVYFEHEELPEAI